MVAQRHARALPARQRPLRRRVDAVEAAIMTVLVVVFAVAAPLLAIITGRIADTAALREQRAERSWRQVTAVLKEPASAGLIGLDGEWGAAFVTARWPVPDGGQRTGQVAVPLNARAGQPVREWVTATGQLTRPRLTRGDVLDRVASAAITSAACLAGVLLLVAIAVRAVAGRRRLAGWARAWEAADPRCSRQR
jgi:hypothetical protein